MPAPAALRLAEVTKIFGEDRAVDRVSLSIEAGSMVALLGPSGCGKTTTLRMIAGLLKPNAGEIYLDGSPITRVPVHRRNIGMLFQNYALFPHMNVAQNIAFGLETRGVGKAAATARVAEARRSWLVQRIVSRGLDMPRASFREANSSALRWPARWSSNRPSCSSTSRWARSTRASNKNMQVELRWRCSAGSRSRRCMMTHDQDEGR